MRRRNPGEPWFHSASGFWCKKIDRELHYLDRDYHVAKKKLAAILRDRGRSQAIGTAWLHRPFAELCDEFLDDVRVRRSEKTYEGYRYRLLRALKILSNKVRVGEIRRLHLTKIEQTLTDKASSTTIRDTLATVQRVCLPGGSRPMCSNAVSDDPWVI